MAGRYVPPDHPRAIFAGDADRDMERLRAQQQQPAPRQRFTPPQRREEHTPEPDVTALRARAAALASPKASTSREGPDPGEIIADIPRADGTVLRVAVKRYHAPNAKPGDPGAPCVDVRVWQSGEPGAWPVKGKGCTVRPRELAALASALLDAAENLRGPR